MKKRFLGLILGPILGRFSTPSKKGKIKIKNTPKKVLFISGRKMAGRKKALNLAQVGDLQVSDLGFYSRSSYFFVPYTHCKFGHFLPKIKLKHFSQRLRLVSISKMHIILTNLNV